MITASVILDAVTKVLPPLIKLLGKESDKNAKTIVSLSSLEEALAVHMQFVNTWSSYTVNPALPGQRELDRAFMHLHVTLLPRRFRNDDNVVAPSTDTAQIVASDEHLMILGDPGAGKTTLVKHVCRQLLTEDTDVGDRRCNFPLLLRCKQAPLTTSLCAWALAELGVHLDLPNTTETAVAPTIRDAFAQLVDELGIFVLVDGLDELPASLQDVFLQDIERLVHTCHIGRFLVTCRSGAFYANLGNCRVLEILPLDPSQQREFCGRILDSKEQLESFLGQLQTYPYADAVGRPLNLAHLTALFKAHGELPDRPRTIYRRLFYLLLEDWDRSNLVRRQSRYARFGTERKAEFLACLAYHATVQGLRGHFSSGELVGLYHKICRRFSLPNNEATLVASEIESHAGLLVKVGYDSYEFTHLSLQEYLAADYIVRAIEIPTEHLLDLAEELAVATGLSSDPLGFLLKITAAVAGRRQTRPGEVFWRRYLSRLLIERPDFSDDPADAFAGLVAVVRSCAPYGDLLDLWKELLKALPELRYAIGRAMSRSDVQERDGGGLLIYPRWDVPPDLREIRYLTVESKGVTCLLLEAQQMFKVVRGSDH